MKTQPPSALPSTSLAPVTLGGRVKDMAVVTARKGDGWLVRSWTGAQAEVADVAYPKSSEMASVLLAWDILCLRAVGVDGPGLRDAVGARVEALPGREEAMSQAVLVAMHNMSSPARAQLATRLANRIQGGLDGVVARSLVHIKNPHGLDVAMLAQQLATGASPDPAPHPAHR